MKTEPLTTGKYYHIYNRGIDGCNLFRDPENYEHFLGLYDKYISPVADTYAWVLMPNHFHLLVKTNGLPKDYSSDEFVQGVSNLTGFENLAGLKPLHQSFSNLFNAYAKAFNKRFGRHGGLFEQPFKRKLISNEKYLKHVILYIHNNPVHHGFCSHAMEYPWSSYLSCVSVMPTKLKRETVLGWFDNEGIFKSIHNEKVEVEKIERWLEI